MSKSWRFVVYGASYLATLIAIGLGQSLAFAYDESELAQKSRDSLAKASTVEARRSVAANQFWGFYLASTRTRAEVCKAEGVDIRTFLLAFKDLHADELRIASEIYARKGANADRLYADPKAHDFFSTVMRKEMMSLANQLGTTVAGACQSMEAHAGEYADLNTLKRRKPEVFIAIHSK